MIIETKVNGNRSKLKQARKEFRQMSKYAVVYWSSTGNTEKMADVIGKALGADIFEVSSFEPDMADKYEKIAFGCPAMGDEVLEEGEFEPFFEKTENKLSGKKVALFGSYGWGDGKWMRDWEERVKNDGANLFANGLIINSYPNDAGIVECEDFGKSFAEF